MSHSTELERVTLEEAVRKNYVYDLQDPREGINEFINDLQLGFPVYMTYPAFGTAIYCLQDGIRGLTAVLLALKKAMPEGRTPKKFLSSVSHQDGTVNGFQNIYETADNGRQIFVIANHGDGDSFLVFLRSRLPQSPASASGRISNPTLTHLRC